MPPHHPPRRPTFPSSGGSAVTGPASSAHPLGKRPELPAYTLSVPSEENEQAIMGHRERWHTERQPKEPPWSWWPLHNSAEHQLQAISPEVEAPGWVWGEREKRSSLLHRLLSLLLSAPPAAPPLQQNKKWKERNRSFFSSDGTRRRQPHGSWSWYKIVIVRFSCHCFTAMTPLWTLNHSHVT